MKYPFFPLLFSIILLLSCTEQEVNILPDTSTSVDSTFVEVIPNKRESKSVENDKYKYSRGNRYELALDTLLLYKTPDTNSIVIDTIYMAEPVYVARSRYPKNENWSDYTKVISYRNAKMGWIKIEQIYPLSSCSRYYEDFFTKYRENPFQFICNCSESFHTNTLQVLKHLKKQYDSQFVTYSNDYLEYNNLWSDNLINQRLAQYYSSQGENPKKAEQYYKRVLNNKHKNVDFNRRVRRSLLSLYQKTDQKKKFEDLAFQIISDDPTSLVEEFECNFWEDENAASALVKQYVDTLYNPQKLKAVCKKILTISKDTAVQLLAHSGLVYHALKENQPDIALERIKYCHENYNHHSRGYFKSTFDHSALPAITMLDFIKYEQKRPDLAIEFNRELIDMPEKDSMLTKAYQFRLKHELRYFNGEYEEIEELEKNRYGHQYGNDIITSFINYNSARRGGHFSPQYNFKPETKDTFTIRENATLKYGLYVDSNFVFQALKNELVTIQDKTNIGTENGSTGYWAKVKNQYDSIYWVFSADLLPLKVKPLFEKDLTEKSIADNCDFEFRKVEHFKNIPIDDRTILVDCDEDGYLDYIQYGLYAYSGKNRSLLWRLKGNGNLSGYFKDGICVAVQAGGKVIAYDKKIGEKIWESESYNYWRGKWTHNEKYVFAVQKDQDSDEFSVIALNTNGAEMVIIKVKGEVTMMKNDAHNLLIATKNQDNSHYLYHIELSNHFFKNEYFFEQELEGLFPAGKFFYLGLKNNRFIKIDGNTKEIVWESAYSWHHSPVTHTLHTVGNNLLLACNGWHLAGFNPETGEKLWNSKFRYRNPLFIGDKILTYDESKLYVLNMDGTIEKETFIKRNGIRKAKLVGNKIYINTNDSELLVYEVN